MCTPVRLNFVLGVARCEGSRLPRVIQGRSADAVACLRLIYDRFTDGFDIADLIAAKRLLDQLGAGARR